MNKMMTNLFTNVPKLFALMLLVSASLFDSAYAADKDVFANKIESIDFSALTGGRVSIRVQLTEALVNPPASFTLNNPARIALDFPQTGNGLAKSNIPNAQGALKSVSIAQAKDRTRMVLNLTKVVGYNTVISGKDVIITLQGNEASATNPTETRFAETKAGNQIGHAISNVDFARGKNGEGRIIVDLSDANTGINIKQKGKQIVVDFANTDVPTELQRRLNVINFNTPVLYVDTMKQGKNGRMVIEPKGEWEQSAYQADKKFIIDVRQVVEDPNKLVKGNKLGYAGEKSSAMRAGLLSVKLAGGLTNASVKCTRILTRPPVSAEKSILSILLANTSLSAAYALPNKLALTKSINPNSFGTFVNKLVIILFISIPIIYSCRLILAVRSTQSPVRSSWIISFSEIDVSSIFVTKPKLGPM